MFCFLFLFDIEKIEILVERKGNKMCMAEYEVEEETLKIKLPEELDHSNTAYIREEADKRIYSGSVRNVEFDFSKTKFMDSSGIGMIMGRYRLVNPIGGKIILSGVQGNIERIIKISGLYKLV